MKKFLIACIYSIIFFAVYCVQARERDSIVFSILTCSPGEQVYELFGHTAIRYRNFTLNEDVVLNYGVFDFRTPNFVMRFVRGETDYQLGIIPYMFFFDEYLSRGSSVYEQVLSLTSSETHRLDSILRVNYMPQNRVYRYNYFYDNCTTRAKDRVVEVVEGKVVFPDTTLNSSFREGVHACTQGHPWAEFGIDLCLGSKADRPIDETEQMFLPENLRIFLNNTYVEDGVGRRRKLVTSDTLLLVGRDNEPEKGLSWGITPMHVAVLLLGLTLLVCLCEWKRRCIYWGWDILLMLLQGIIGCVVAFLFFFSEHPTVSSNYLLILFNPLPLCYLPAVVCKLRRHQKTYYDRVNIIILTLFIAFWGLIPQKISLVVVPLALSLLLRSIMHIWIASNSERV